MVYTGDYSVYCTFALFFSFLLPELSSLHHNISFLAASYNPFLWACTVFAYFFLFSAKMRQISKIHHGLYISSSFMRFFLSQAFNQQCFFWVQYIVYIPINNHKSDACLKVSCGKHTIFSGIRILFSPMNRKMLKWDSDRIISI